MLAGWAAAVARFREDANAEEDHALGGYRDRLVVELAQNAADAALRASAGGVLRLELAGDLLTAANTGAPLDAAGVEALSTLRASAKRSGESAGRFGVGFAAVLAVSDEPCVVSQTGAVRWSLAEARTLAASASDEVAAEIARRGGVVPLLRLPFAAGGTPPEGFATEVRLPLRSAESRALAERLLAEVDPTLLLGLPALSELTVVVDGRQRRLTAAWSGDEAVVGDEGGSTRWRVLERSGEIPVALLADRPVEERARRAWSVRWAVPVDSAGAPVALPPAIAPVVRAPTVTDEPLALPAALVATLPLDPSRRHVAAGALADFVAERAGAAYAELLRALPADAAVLGLVPVGAAAGAVEAVVRRAALAALPEVPLLPAASDPEVRLRGRDAAALDVSDDALVTVLADVVPGLVPAAWAAGPAPAALGVRRLPLAEVVDALTAVERPPGWWHRLYAALDRAVPPGPARDVLGGLPVPLATGQLVRGPRGLMLPDADPLPAGLDALGVRLVDPAAAHPLLGSLGAAVATPRSLLDDARVQAAVASSYDEDEPGPVADAVLGLVAAAAVGPGELPWLGELALPGADGEWYTASELLLPGARLAAVVADDAPFGVVAGELVERWGASVLVAVGVLDAFATVSADDVPVDPDLAEHDLDGEAEWLADVEAALADAELPALVTHFEAVRDLELVRPEAWPQALAMLAEPPLRGTVVTPARLLLADGRGRDVVPYTAWWLARQALIGGVPLGSCAVDDLGGLWEPVELALDDEFLAAVGVLTSLGDAVAREPAAVLARLADPARPVTRAALAAALELLAGADVDPPDRVRGIGRDGGLVVVDAEDAVVVDRPDLVGLVGSRPVLPVRLGLAEALADTLAVAVASELARYEVRSAPVGEARWAGVPGVEEACAVAAAPVPSGLVCRHAPLLVADADGVAAEVRWRADGDADHPVDHVRDGDPGALGRALAWRMGRWDLRAVLGELLDPAADRSTLRREAEL